MISPGEATELIAFARAGVWLPEPEQECVLLWRQMDYGYERAAKELGVSPSRVWQIAETMKKILERERLRVSDKAAAAGAHRLPVTALGLSTRTENALLGIGVRTVGECARLTEIDVLRMKRCGRKSLSELRQALGDRGIALSGIECRGCKSTAVVRVSKYGFCGVECAHRFLDVHKERFLRGALGAVAAAAGSTPYAVESVLLGERNEHTEAIRRVLVAHGLDHALTPLASASASPKRSRA